MWGFLVEADFDFDIWNVVGIVLQVWLPSPDGAAVDCDFLAVEKYRGEMVLSG